MDIVDLASSASTCKTFPRVPGGEEAVVGGLGFENEPLVCTGNKAETYSNDCYAYHEGSWTLSDKVNEVRGYAAVSGSPYPKETHRFLVAGGHSLLGQLNTVEILTENGWKTDFPVMPVKADFHCMVQLNSTTVMLIGGVQVSLYPTFVNGDCS